jgi:hypothetical protein
MIKLTQEREITPYVWVHPDDDRGRDSLAHGLDRCGRHYRSGKRSGHGRGAQGDSGWLRFGSQPVASASGQHEGK